jgi:branched-chain amino acid transport system permease protein
MLAAVLAGALLSWLLGFPAFRLRGPYYTLTTIAFAELTRIGVQSTREVFGWRINGARGLLIPSLGEAPLQFQSLHKAFYYEIILGMLLVVVLASLWMRRSKLGHEWAAVREDEMAAAGPGIDVRRAKLRAAAISGAFTAAGGVFYAQLVLYVDPARVLGLDLSVESAVVALAGGAGTIGGPIVGALVLRPIAELLQFVSGTNFRGLHLVLYGAALILVASRFPRGIAGMTWKWPQVLLGRSLRRPT